MRSEKMKVRGIEMLLSYAINYPDKLINIEPFFEFGYRERKREINTYWSTAQSRFPLGYSEVPQDYVFLVIGFKLG